MKKTTILLFLLPLLSFAQDKGLKFENGLNWKQIQEKAKSENKPIFMDCFATWCGPCKYMDKNIFTQQEVADYMNAHFICVKVQMDKTSGDAQNVQDWYNDAAILKSSLKISDYPTYLFFSPVGKPIHRFSGSSDTQAEFLERVYAALDPASQYFTLLQNWEKRKTDSVYLLHALIAAKNAGDIQAEGQIATSYIDCLKQPITKYNISLLSPLIISEMDKGFQLFLQNASKINELTGKKNYVESKLGEIIFREKISPLLQDNKKMVFGWKKTSADLQNKYPSLDKDQFAGTLDLCFQNFINHDITVTADKKEMQMSDWQLITQKLKRKYPDYDFSRNVLNQEMMYYFRKKLWNEATNAAISLIDQYGSEYPDRFINDICWNIIFLHSGNKEVLEKATKHMERVAKNNPSDLADQDTYANLLYKIGRRQEAIEWESKTIASAAGNVSDKDFKDNLEKMQRGTPTWEDSFPVTIN